MPWPYSDILPAGAGRTGKVHVARASETRFLAKFLERLLRNPGYASPQTRREDYLTDRDTAWALNAYNLRTAAREHGCWALFHRFQNTSVFLAPFNVLGGPILLHRPHLARALGPRPGYYNFARDFEPAEPPHAWVSPAQDPWRRGPNAKRYRLVCWMHRHEAPLAEWKNDQYSMTVWDRDVSSLPLPSSFPPDGTLTWAKNNPPPLLPILMLRADERSNLARPVARHQQRSALHRDPEHLGGVPGP